MVKKILAIVVVNMFLLMGIATMSGLGKNAGAPKQILIENPTTNSNDGRVYGHVTYRNDYVSGVEVSLWRLMPPKNSKYTCTDSNGYYEFNNVYVNPNYIPDFLLNNSYYVEIYKEGYCQGVYASMKEFSLCEKNPEREVNLHFVWKKTSNSLNTPLLKLFENNLLVFQLLQRFMQL